MISAVSENGYLFHWHVNDNHLKQIDEVEEFNKLSLRFAKKIHNGSVEALHV